MNKKEIIYNYKKDKNKWIIYKGGKIKLRKLIKNLADELLSIDIKMKKLEIDLEMDRGVIIKTFIKLYDEGGLTKISDFMTNIQNDLINKMQEVINSIGELNKDEYEDENDSPVADEFINNLSEEKRKELSNIQDVVFEEIKPNSQGLGIEGVDPTRL